VQLKNTEQLNKPESNAEPLYDMERRKHGGAQGKDGIPKVGGSECLDFTFPDLYLAN